MSNTADWDAVPVKGGTKTKVTAQSSGGSNTADWDAVPVKAAGASAAATGQPQSAMQQQLGRIKSAGDQAMSDIKGGNVVAPAIGAGEAALNMVTGIGSSAVGGLAGLARIPYEMAQGESFSKAGDLASQTMEKIQKGGTYEPRTGAGKLFTELVGSPMVAATTAGSTVGGGIGQAIGGDAGRVQGEKYGSLVPEVAATVLGGAAALKGVRPAPPQLRPMPATAAAPAVSDVPAYVRKAQADFEAAKANGQPVTNPTTPPGTTQANPAAPAPIPTQGPQSAGAAAASKTSQAEAAGATPAVLDAIKQAEAKGQINSTAAQRHIEASSLPVPVDLTRGQAMGDVNILSHEQNVRGKHPELAERFNKQNGQLVENIEAIRDKAAPDVYYKDHVEAGQSLIDSYKAKDSALSADISAKYKALEDANGGQFPVDGQAFVAAAEQALNKKMKGRYVPAEIQADMDAIRGGGTMTYENFENMRTNLAAEARKAERSGDGNRAMATSLVRDALESIPITGESAALKPLADAARNAAKARFDLIKNDPAYKAAVNDSISADKFIDRYVVGKSASVKNLKTMRENLAHDELAGQTIASGTVNFLKDRAMGSSNTFKQSGFNNTLKDLRPKLGDLVAPEQAAHLEALGNVARYTQEQPAGAYVNNSNTLVGATAMGAKNLAMGAIDVKTLGATKFARDQFNKMKEKREIQESLKPGAGVNLSDLPR